MENKNMYVLIGKIALEFRVSLTNICKLLGKNPDDNNKMEVYNSILSTTSNPDLKNAYNYLFNYETINEKQMSSSLSFTKAAMFLKKYLKAQKENDNEQISLLSKELTRTEDKFDEIKKRQERHLSLEDITDISKYRLKHCISQIAMSEFLGISRKALFDNENKITDSNLRTKLELICNYFEDLTVDKNFRRK